MKRRQFIAATAGLAFSQMATAATKRNPLPQWRGFNLLDFFSPYPERSRKSTSEDHFRWMRDWGFDFVRIPVAYPYYLDIDHSVPITPDQVYKISEQQLEKIDQLVLLAHKYGMHVSLNLHRAPGYCVNAGFHEPFNLWKDAEALDAFCFHWNMWAHRYRGISTEKLSFDLLNEPSMREDMNDQHSKRTAVPGDLYRKLVVASIDAIRKERTDRLIVADGNNIGNDVIPEIADLEVAQSCRGYYPGIISHYKAPWAMRNPDAAPDPKWPGKVGDQQFSRAMLEKYYEPWIELARSGVGVHCGECGCWNKTPHDVFLAWFSDVLDILSQNHIGFAIWEFSGSFGVLNSGRSDVDYEDWYGEKLDRKMLQLLQKY
jgi:endoglucanase